VSERPLSADTGGERLFDCYIFVDWSASNRPGPGKPVADSVFSAELDAGRETPATRYHRTRDAAGAYLRERLKRAVERHSRVLIGFDFPYGYPRGFAARLARSAAGPAWRVVWDHLAAAVEDSADNRNNRFVVAARINAAIGATAPGPFWGCPRGQRHALLEPTSPGFPYPTGGGSELARIRACEARLKGTQEAWKLLGVGSVGSQALTGIPHVRRLRFHEPLAGSSRVWPFETGFTSLPTQSCRIVHAEIWPGLVRERVNRWLALDPRAIKDELQVAELAKWAAELDGSGALGRLFDAPPGMGTAELAVFEAEEGWVLGA
jgi:hypothetical protein